MQHNFDDPFGEETLDLQKLIKKYLHLWPWFVLSLVVAFGLAWLNNAYQHNVYNNSLTLLITEEEPLLQLDNTVGSTFSVSSTRIKNEIGIISSRTLILKTINSLDFSVEYHLRNSFLDHEVYPNNYFRVEIDSIWPQPINVPILFSRNEDGTWKISAQWEDAQLYSLRKQNYLGQTGKANIELNANAGEWIEEPHIRFRINENPNNQPKPDQQFIVYFRDINTLASRYLGLNVEEIQNSTMLRMSIQGNNRQKNAAFLNKHAETFLQRELDKKNFRAQKTIDFIDEQLALVSQSLSNSESNLEDFRSEGQILNLDYQAQQSFSRLETLQQQRTNLTIKGKYYQYLENYLDQVGENGSDLIAPSSLGIDDPLLSELIMELIQRYTERSEVMINSRRDNPFIANLESRIEITKNTIKESLSNVMQSNKMAMADLDERIADLSSKISTIPESQRHLFNIERQFTLHDNLFTFLQNKKSDIEITKAGFTPVHEIIDPSNPSDGRLVSPKKRMTYYIAGFAGLLVPVLLIFLYEFFNDRIRANEDIERITNYPILGYISRNGIKQNQLVSFDKPSIQAESFRSIRTNAQFILPTHDVPVIMFTSTLLEEGKTFASLNMAVGYASMGKKTVLLSFDLRKPKLFKYLETGVELGLSNYISSDLSVKDIVRKGPVNNLDILFSGQIPPNPAELLSSPKMEELFAYLKSNYDIILVDTPPVGMVADSLLLVNYCNAIIYLVRHNRTPVKYLQQTLRNLKEKDIKNLNIVLNDIPPPGRFSSYNAYGYQYGYFEKEQS
jgi:capsular exopolysaccharide synthesis family protein